MENKEFLTIAVTDFSVSPGPRYCNQGEDSGELFYHKILNPSFTQAINEDKILEIILDGADGYASSFLDEAFGNLVYDFGQDVVIPRISIISKEPEWIDMIKKDTCPQWQKKKKRK